jgi:amino acid adenylation domain-containing protein
MKNIYIFFKDLLLNEGAIWLTNKNISLSVPPTMQNPETKKFLEQYKNQIVLILNENKIFSKTKFLETEIFKNIISENYPLSYSQERLWFIEQYEGGTNAYHVCLLYELDSNTQKKSIIYALEQIVLRHEILRSTIEQGVNQEHAIQIVHDGKKFIEEITLKDTEDYKPLIKEEINKPFNLSTEYPIRATLYTIESVLNNSLNKTLLVINMHHIVSDEWSLEIFQKELFAYFEANVKNDSGFSLPKLDIQYKDYALWQKFYLTRTILEDQLKYWKGKLTGYQTLEFPVDYARPVQVDYRGSIQNFSFSEEISRKLRALAQRKGTSLNSVMLSSIYILLNKYTGQTDITVGGVIANRHHRQTEELIGFFVNTQAHRQLLSNTQTFEELVQQVFQDQIEAQSYQDLPFEKLVDELKVERDASRHPIFQIMFIMQSSGYQNKESEHQKKYLKSYQQENTYEVEKFDLSIFIDDSQEALGGYISYATSLFHKDTISKFIQHYSNLIEQICEATDKFYSAFSLLHPKEYKQIVYDWNATDTDFLNDKTICELFEEQVKRTPDHTALVYKDEKLTYRELNERSNQLAYHIRTQYTIRTKQSLEPDTFVALFLDRSLEMIIGILATLKSGAAYVPIGANYPQERVDYILENTQAEIILSKINLEKDNNIQLPQDKVIFIDLSQELYSKYHSINLPKHSYVKDLAYVIFTSGTTGKPKGVMVEQAGVINLIDDLLNKYVIEFSENFLLFSNYVFDASVEQILLPLLSGGKLFVIDNQSILDNTIFENFVIDNSIEHVHATPSYLSTIDPSKLKHLKRVIFGGEPLSENLFKQFKNYIPIVVNKYGPTEATVTSLISINSNLLSRASIQNTKAYILDTNRIPIPKRVTGELYISGAGLARGYLNRQDLTSEHFVENPFATELDKLKGYTRMYKTGDLVRWLPDGTIEYISRNDDQVKIRGYRIELGEIENAFKQIEGIKQVCVLAKDREPGSVGTNYLVGYYVLNDGENLDEVNIQNKLSQILPEYMIPASLIRMESFPLTTNGKLDKRALPDPNFGASDEEYEAPNTALEKKICCIYADILGLTKHQISTHESFFRMGGNSILSIRLKHKLTQLDEFKNISIADLFKYNTINKLIQSIQTTHVTTYHLRQNKFDRYDHEIAIIATSGAFSGVKNIAEFWDLISNQKEGIQFLTKEECKELDIDESFLSNPHFIPVLAQVKDIELFDPLFWDISPNEAKQLDPQIRKFIEHCWFALESAGYAQQRKNHTIGVFAGSGYSSYFYDHILNGEIAEQVNKWEAASSNSKDALATKTAFLLGLTGPATAINTACSTGLVSVVEACEKLQLGTCDMALAGGVSFQLPYHIGYIYEDGMISSKDGHCKTFDKDASGTISGSGVGVVLLKRLEDAVKDNDTILGVIKGYASNNDGDRKTGFTAPSVMGQSECIINSQRMAGVNPDQIDYIECHGTATNLGDPIEVQALKEAFDFNKYEENNLTHKTVLGSVKANIGHANSAAGTAGLIKICCMLQHDTLPGQVNFNTLNPELQLEQSAFEIIKENRTWSSNSTKQRLAGVSSFGIGGTNAHVIIGDYINSRKNQHNIRQKTDEQVNFIIPISAKSRQSLEQNKQALIDYLTQAKPNNKLLKIQDIAYSLQERREHFCYRSATCAKSIDDLILKLKQDSLYSEVNVENNNKVVFMFPGQGVQYTGMAKELYDNEPFFRQTIDVCIQLSNPHMDVDLYQVLFVKQESLIYDINEIKWSQVALFIVEYSLAKFLEQLGVKADAYIGHSFGEYVAATLAGVFKLEDAIKVLIVRGKLMQSMEPGSMLAINAKEEEIRSIIIEYDCEIALINSADDVVVSGTHEAINELYEKLERQGIPITRVNGSVAGHSKLMEKASKQFEHAFENIQLTKPSKIFISNLSGEVATAEVATARYWGNQLRNTVQFGKGIAQLSEQNNHQITFIEVGTGKGLIYFVNKFKKQNGYKSIQTLQLLPSAKEAKDVNFRNVATKEDITAKLWMSAIIQKPNSSTVLKHSKLELNMPVYQFNFQKYWLEKGDSKGEKKFNSLNELFYQRSWERISVKAGDSLKKMKSKNMLVLIHDIDKNQQESIELLNMLSNHCENVTYVINNGINNIAPDKTFDFSSSSHIKTIFTESNNTHSIDLVIYISPTIDIDNPAFDIISIRNIFDWSKTSGHKIPQFISVSFDNYEITGTEKLQQKPSIVYGVTKSLPFEYFTSGTKAFHIDLSTQDANYKKVFFSTLDENEDSDFIAIRGKYKWIPIFKKLKLNNNRAQTNYHLENNKPVFLITGGLGALGHVYANSIALNEKKSTIIILGRTNEFELRSDYKQRLMNLRKSRHDIIYRAIDISKKNAVSQLEELLKEYSVHSIEVVLHTAAVVAKSALYEKKQEDIEQVVNPKICGLEYLIKASASIKINYFVCCSSMSSIIPRLGQMEYTAANIYLDEISYRTYPNIRHLLSINLNQISDIGAAVEFMEGNSINWKASLNSITSFEFPGILEKMLNFSTPNNIALSRYDIHSTLQENTQSFNAHNDQTKLQEEIKIIEDVYTEKEYQVALVFCNVLGLEQISKHDDFFKIGGNSILAIKVSHQISKILESEVRVADIFKYKSSKAIAENIKYLEVGNQNLEKVF